MNWTLADNLIPAIPQSILVASGLVCQDSQGNGRQKMTSHQRPQNNFKMTFP